MEKNTGQLDAELKSSALPKELVDFLLHLLKGEPISNEIYNYIKQKTVPGVNFSCSEGPIRKMTREDKVLNALDPYALIKPHKQIDSTYKNIKYISLVIKQAPSECIFNNDSLNNFYREVFPNIETSTEDMQSSLTIFLPKKQSETGISTWDLYNISDGIFSSLVSNDIKQIRKFRLAILMTLLKQLNRENKNYEENELTKELIERLSLPLRDIGEFSFALDDDLTKKIINPLYVKENTLLNFTLESKFNSKMEAFKVVTIKNANIKDKKTEHKPDIEKRKKDNKNKASAKDVAEANRAEQGACWGLGYFLASFDGLAIKITLPDENKYPLRNIIIAPKVMCDTLRQIQPYRSNYLTGSIEYIKGSDTFLHHKPYHSNKTPRIGKEPSSLQEPKTSIAKLLLGGAGSRSLEPHEYVLEETGIPGETKQVPLNKEPLETQELIHFPIYLPPFLRAQTFEDFVSKSPQRR